MEVAKLTETDYADKGVTGLPDIPNLSATEMQQKLDELSKSVLGPKINELIDALENEETDRIAHESDTANPHRVTAAQLDVPYVASSGTDGIWTYRKWSDGTAECWGSVSVATGAANTADGGVYCTGATDIASQTYPFIFTAVPVCCATAVGSTDKCWLRTVDGTGSASQTPAFQVLRSTSGSADSVTVSLHALGRWE